MEAGALEGTEWRLAEHFGPDGALVPVPAGVTATATLGDGRIAGSTGCNRYSGIITVDGTTVTIGQLAVTRMACIGPADAVERAMLAGLEATSRFALGDEGLELADADGSPVLRFRSAPALRMTGTRWVAIGINNGRGGVVSSRTLGAAEVSIEFAEDGRASGSGGCNQFSAAYAVEGDGVRIGPVVATRMLCSEPAGVDEQEAWYFAALERASRWSIQEGRLQLRDDDGALQVDYRPATGAAG